MAASKKRLGDLLLNLRLITLDQLDQAVRAQKESGLALGATLVSMGYITEDLLLNALASQLGVSPWRLEENPADPRVVSRVPLEICHTYRVLPVAIRGDLLVLAMVNPHDVEAIERVRAITRMRIEPVLAEAERLAKAIDSITGGRHQKEDLDNLVDAALRDFKVDKKVKETAAQLTEADTRPVVGLVNQILTDAIRAGASDVHIEPRKDRVEVRYRIDGHLEVASTLPATLLPMLTTRLKIMAELDIVETRLPQDGRVAAELDGRFVDLRVSVLPNYHGGRIVLRVLDKTASLKRLDEIGFAEEDLTMFRSMVGKPYGIFLVTGPTGSGKTTTLYAALQELRRTSNNVMTCEDPVEYEIDGVNQSQVNEKVGLTFAKQLRAILRQDPDVILVGEVRDGETAETAIRAALTGHMVLSTLHCNDAPSSIPRLLDMGIDPYLLSTSLVGVMAQRLVRKLCPDCRVAYAPSTGERALMGAYGFTAETLYRPVGCPKCGGTGYRGRQAVHEIMPISPSVGSLIAARAPIESVREEATHFGYRPMQHRTLALVTSGATSLEEASRCVFLDVAHAVPAVPSAPVAATPKGTKGKPKAEAKPKGDTKPKAEAKPKLELRAA